MNATFPEAEVEREKKRQLDLLAQTEKNGGAIASRVRAILAFGPDHPYGRPAQGLPRTVQGITRDDLVAFHKDRWKPGSSALVFVGRRHARRRRPRSPGSISAHGAAAPPRR